MSHDASSESFPLYIDPGVSEVRFEGFSKDNLGSAFELNGIESKLNIASEVTFVSGIPIRVSIARTEISESCD
jgi:hypothetical protein